jgi:hypothetical protein
MTARWPLVIFHNIIDMSSYNVFVIWNKINPTWMPDKLNKRRVFLDAAGKGTCNSTHSKKGAPPLHSSLCSACESCSVG